MTNDQSQELTSQAALQALVLDSELQRLEDLLAEFNLFDVLGISQSENRHSALLAWLLNPQGSHGLRDYFLRNFLLIIAEEGVHQRVFDITPLDVDAWILEDVEASTEVTFKGSRGRYNRIDILLIGQSDEFVCLIENKIHAGEYSGQLRRYLKAVEKEHTEKTILPVFLTPNGVEPEAKEDAKRYVSLSHDSMSKLVSRVLCMRRSSISEGVATFLDQYAKTLRRHVLDNAEGSDDIDNLNLLAYRLYTNHRAAIELIFKAKGIYGSIRWEGVDSVVQQCSPDLQRDFHAKNIRRFFPRALDEIDELKEGTEWTSSRCLVLFEFKYNPNSTTLYLQLLIGPGPEATRQRLYKAAKENRRVFQVASKFGAKWNRIYQKNITDQQSYNPSNLRELKQKVEPVVREFYENDYWPIVDTIRKEFGLAPTSRSQGSRR